MLTRFDVLVAQHTDECRCADRAEMLAMACYYADRTEPLPMAERYCPGRTEKGKENKF